MQQIDISYDHPHNTERLSYIFDIKTWLIPFINRLEQHSRPHAFKFQLSDDGSEVDMWYRHWSSKGDWVGDSDGKPFHVLSGYPNGEPTLLRATYASQNSMEAIESGVRYCDERFTAAERQWWREFLVEEKTNRAGWNDISEEELQNGGGLGWYFHKLEEYEKLAVPIFRESQDVEKKLNAVRERIAKSQKFKAVSFNNIFQSLVTREGRAPDAHISNKEELF